MIILACSSVSLSFGVNKILENITFHVQNGEKAGLVGVNGAGKSSLFKIITGQYVQDSGEVYTAKGTTIGCLEQNSGLETSNTLWDELLQVYAHLLDMEKRIRELEKVISSEKNPEALTCAMKEYDRLTESYASSGGYEYNSRIRGVLKGLGFQENQFHNTVLTLSGGQKTRLALAKLLLEEPDLLLLDEPTNHLDIDALEWLEDFLKSYKKSVLVISHDRYFLDAFTTKTVELENCGCKVYNGSYSTYIKQKVLDREILLKHYEMQQNEIARMEAFIEQQRRWNREKNIKAAESRQKAIDRMEKIEKPRGLPAKISMRFKSGVSGGNDVLFAEELSKAYPGKLLFDRLSFQLKKNERVFLLGPNGCGKSTLLKILAGRLEPTSGSFEYGHKIIPGYYDQELTGLNVANSVLEEVWNSHDRLTQTEIRSTLASFLFRGEDVFKPISALSGGEKSRVALAKLMLSGSNFLMLDEPTNHLDINSREVLENALQEFDGTILAVSHDRYFIRKLATRILEFDGSSLADYQGDYPSYLEHRNSMRKGSGSEENRHALSASKLEHLQSKEEKARQRRLEKQLVEAEQEIARLEARLEGIGTDMEQAASDHIRLLELHEEQSGLESRLEQLYNLWETLMEEREKTSESP